MIHSLIQYTIFEKCKEEQSFILFQIIKTFTVRFTKLLTNGFRSSFEIPEVH